MPLLGEKTWTSILVVLAAGASRRQPRAEQTRRGHPRGLGARFLLWERQLDYRVRVTSADPAEGCLRLYIVLEGWDVISISSHLLPDESRCG